MHHVETFESRRFLSNTPITSTGPLTDTPVQADINHGKNGVTASPLHLSGTGTLFVRGTSDRDRIAIKQTGGVITVFNNGSLIPNDSGFGKMGDGLDASLVKRINISGAGGRDLVTAQVAPRIKLALADSTHTDVLTRYTLDGERMDDNKHSVIG